MVVAVDWSVQLSDSQVWQREAVIVEAHAVTDEPFTRLRADTLVIPGVDVVPLEFRRSERNDQVQLRLGWLLFPHGSGDIQLQLPTIRYTGGRRNTKWQPPSQLLQVQALPPYVPPTLPVGRVRITSHVEPTGVLRPGHLAYWHVSLQSEETSTAQFPPLLKQLPEAKGVQWFPAKINRQINETQATVQSRMDYRIPLKPDGSGRLALPTLRWHWFDPHTGKLAEARHEPKKPWVLAVWQQALLGISLGLLLLFAAWRVLLMGKRGWLRRAARQRVKASLTSADFCGLRHAMRECAHTHRWPENMSSGQWLDRWQQRYGQDASLADALKAAEARRFSPNPPSSTHSS